MSSRALRRLQGDAGIGLDLIGDLSCEDEDSNDDCNDGDGDQKEDVNPNNLNVLKSKKKKKKCKQTAAPVNPFLLLDDANEENSDNEDEKDEHESDNETEIKTDNKELKAVSRSKKKKKSKKKNKGNEAQNGAQHINKEAADEVEASLQEVNRILGEMPSASASFSQDHNVVNMKPLLHVDHRNLNPETELKKMFGSQVVRGEQRQERNRRQRNRPVQRSSRLVQPKDTWHPTGGSGLSMRILSDSDTYGFTFLHSPAYQKLQFEFLDGVESGHPEAIVNILRKHPYHIDSLMQMADFHRMNEDYQTSAESIEKALYGMECAFHPMFNFASGCCHLPYNRPENRAFYLCVFKHILNLGRRGCNRTAFEFCKLLLSLDPADDPLDCMSMLDFYALRSEQYEYLIRLEREAMNPESSKRIPNFAFSMPLANFKESLNRGEDTTTADKMLQDSLLYFPTMLMPLLDQCNVQPDKRVSSHTFFDTKPLLDETSELGRLVTLYVKRCNTCWKEPAVIAWLERNVVTVLDIVDEGTDSRIHDYAEIRKQLFKKPPLSLLRHYHLSEIEGVGPPQRFMSRSVLNHDPFPPPGSIISYARPPRANHIPPSSRSLLRSFFESIRPSYDPNQPAVIPMGEHGAVPAEEMEAEGAEGGRGIPAAIQVSVNAIMDAMRQLLNEPFAGNQGERQAEDAEEENEDGGWED